jgi:uncharacterized protein (TIGR03435 family)
MLMMRLQFLLLAFALPHAPAIAQDTPARLTFDVATIRPSAATDRSGWIKPLAGGNGYTAQNIPIKLMISLMYRVPMRQISGGPDWIESDRYNVEAKADHPYTIDDLRIMYQNLLADRLNLKFHKETKEGSLYALMVDTPGTRMKIDTSPQNFDIPITYNQSGNAVGVRVPIPYLCWWLGQQLQADQRPVIDKTGLDKNYDFTLSFAPVRPLDASPSESQLPSIFDAVKQELGLKLHPQKGPVDYYVIDHIERPSAN